MSSKVITKEARKKKPPAIAKEENILDTFPTAKTVILSKTQDCLDKTKALDKYTSKNSLLYRHCDERKKEKSLLDLADWSVLK